MGISSIDSFCEFCC